MPDASTLDLLVHADQLDCVPDAEGLALRDLQPLGSATRVFLTGSGGEEIAAETPEAIDRDARYRLQPKQSSLRAFARAQT